MRSTQANATIRALLRSSPIPPQPEDIVPASLSESDRAAIDAVAASLEAAWNAGDGEAFGAAFTDDADFVNIRAEHMRSRVVIAEGHTGIFRSIYAGSRTRQSVESARLLTDDVALAHVTSVLDAPTGPLAGRHVGRYSMVLLRTPDGWRIASFHNTLEPPGAPRS
jgi:uncharacterized protein (TIGR02246 family)